jgi:hypothetical protein
MPGLSRLDLWDMTSTLCSRRICVHRQGPCRVVWVQVPFPGGGQSGARRTGSLAGPTMQPPDLSGAAHGSNIWVWRKATEASMGLLSRFLGTRGRRRTRPAASRAAGRVGAAKRIKKSRRSTQLRASVDRITRSLTRNSRSVDGKKLVAVYHHGTCTVNHRSRKSASRCRRTN